MLYLLSALASVMVSSIGSTVMVAHGHGQWSEMVRSMVHVHGGPWVLSKNPVALGRSSSVRRKVEL